jgi:peptidase M42 family hydrolase
VKKLTIDRDWLRECMLQLLAIPSPVGLTDAVVHYTARRFEEMDIPYELTRRGAIRATLSGALGEPARAVVAHLDTLGAMVRELKPNGRLAVVPIGHWSARFAEGGRVTVYTDAGHVRGTVLPVRASGHAFGDGVDTLPVGWEHVEVRMDVDAHDAGDLLAAGFHVGDFVSFDTNPEVLPNGYVTARHLDDKAAVAAMLAACNAVVDAGVALPINCHPLLTITEEVGSGASAALHGHVSEMVSHDIGIAAPGQNSDEHSVTICVQDSTGPFDYHLTRRLIEIAGSHAIPHRRDVYRYYRSDSASAVEAGNDIRTALVGFGGDASHGYERAHLDGICAMAELMALYMQSEPVAARDSRAMGPIEGFTTQIAPEDMRTPAPQLPDPGVLLSPGNGG